MNRRTVLGALTGALLAAPLAAGAQRVGSVPTVGVLTPGMASSPLARPSNEAFERGLQEHGWVPGQSIRIEYRYADGKPGRVNALAAEFVRMRVDLIIARSSAVALAAKGATTTIPIVMAGSCLDPVRLGLVSNLAKPGGNVTGLTIRYRRNRRSVGFLPARTKPRPDHRSGVETPPPSYLLAALVCRCRRPYVVWRGLD